jgi:hypothetical protein
MNKFINKFNPSTLYLLIAGLLVTATSILLSNNLPSFTSFTPVFAMALFAGSTFTNYSKSLLVAVVAVFAADLFINAIVFKGQWGIVQWSLLPKYLGLVAVTLIGRFGVKKNAHVVLGGILGATSFYVVMDVLYWLSHGTNLATNLPLTYSFSDLLVAFKQGWPFYRNSLVATTVFSALFFGIHYFATEKKTALA